MISCFQEGAPSHCFQKQEGCFLFCRARWGKGSREEGLPWENGAFSLPWQRLLGVTRKQH